MPSYGQSVTLQYVAWDTGANAPRPGDAANHTLRWVKDGAGAAPTNAAGEVDAANAPGVYKVVMTAAEASCQVGTLCGKSSTAGVVILPATVTFENLPTAAPAASGGLPTVGSGGGQLNPSGGAVPVSGTVTLAATTHAGAVIPTVTSVANAVTVGTNNDKAGYRLDLTQAVPASNAAQTVGDALNAARAQGFGRWVLSGTSLTLYAADGTTVVRTFTLDSATTPTQRS